MSTQSPSQSLISSALSPSATFLVGAFAATLALDLWSLGRETFDLVFTALQSALLLLWAKTVLTLDASENQQDRGTQARRRQRYWHVVLIALAVYTAFEKWRVVLEGAETRSAHLASYRILTGALTTIALVGLFGRGSRFARFFVAMADHPARLMTLSFALSALGGGYLLTLPASLHHIEDASFIDALFTATSAVCVTGLAVNTISETYTWFGQCVILALIQIGGLGIMALSASFVILAGRRMKAKQSAMLAEMIDAESLNSLRRTLLTIVVFTLLIEAFGALALYEAIDLSAATPRLRATDHAFATAHPAWIAVFHSVSAFCNAGFALTRDSMAHYVASPFVCVVLMLLITLGGIGFPVMLELTQHLRARFSKHRPPRISLHTRIVLTTSASLVALIALAFGVLEWTNSLRDLSWPVRALSALFQSVTLRTAGFNTVDIGQLENATLLACCLFMLVGASPGGTGGGMKTTTIAVLFAAFRAEMRGDKDPTLLDRNVPVPIVNRAVAVAFVSLAILTSMLFTLFLTEEHPPMSLFFEAVSAFGTVGLSTGITADLSRAGKLVITLTMLVGRVGPLTIALAAARRGQRRSYVLPEERVMIG